MRQDDAANALGVGALDDEQRLVAVEMAGGKYQVVLMDEVERAIERGDLGRIGAVELIARALGVETCVFRLDAPGRRNVAAVVAAQMSLAAHRRHPDDEAIAIHVSGGHVALPPGKPGPHAVIIDPAAIVIERDRSDQRYRIVRAPDLADLAGRGLKVVFHDDAKTLAPRFLGQRRGIVLATQKFRADVHMHADDALVADMRKRVHRVPPSALSPVTALPCGPRRPALST